MNSKISQMVLFGLNALGYHSSKLKFSDIFELGF